MATKKKTKKKKSTPKKSARKKVTSLKAARKNPSRKSAKKQIAKRRKVATKKPVRRKRKGSGTPVFLRGGRGSRLGEQSGDLQGLSRSESADSESVDELLEEGNAFEAAAVSGVEDADVADGREVRTHEVPEDDVPEEYLDKE
jgi:N utilization substance protein A